MIFRKLLPILSLLLFFNAESQIAYQNVKNKNLSLGSYGRIGTDWSFENDGSIGRRLNLNNMGSIGGRLEEQDYLELVPTLHFEPVGEDDPTEINMQMRFSVFSKSLAHLGYESTLATSGLGISLPELYVEGKNIGGSGINLWVGARLYRGGDVHIIDHFYFNDHSGQGFGVEFKNTRLGALFIAATDASGSLPPYFYLNIISGTPSAALRQRSKLFVEQDFHFGEKHMLTGLAEYHRMGSGDYDEQEGIAFTFPSDFGFLIGARLSSELNLLQGANNKFAIRYGSGIANGGEGGMARSYLTFGAPNLDKRNFQGAFSVSVVDEFFGQINDKHSFSAYGLFTQSEGAGASKGLELGYDSTLVTNSKVEMSFGIRESWVITKYFKLLTELHYAQRKDAFTDLDWASMTKISFAPTITPTGDKSFWARPELRFVSSFAWYNQTAADHNYSPYLSVVGNKKFGYYLGIKAEWWLWN